MGSARAWRCEEAGGEAKGGKPAGGGGVLAAGKRADLNVIDMARITLRAPEFTADLPGGAARLVQAAEGYDATLVAGTVTRRNDTDTGARPGRLVRSA